MSSYCCYMAPISSSVPCGLHKLLEDTFRKYGNSRNVQLLLQPDSTDTEQQPASETISYRETGLASSSLSTKKQKLEGGSRAADRALE